MKRHAWTAYLYSVAAAGLSLAVVASTVVPALPSSAGAPPVVSTTTGPAAPAPSASASPSVTASNPAAVGVHGAPTPRVELVGTTPTVGLPPSPGVSSPGPTVLPTPSATASGSSTPSPSPSATPSASPTAAVNLAIAAHILGVHVTVTVGLPPVGQRP